VKLSDKPIQGLKSILETDQLFSTRLAGSTDLIDGLIFHLRESYGEGGAQMTAVDQLEHYSALLRVRQKGRRREVRLSGGVFLISLVLTLGLGLVNEELGRSIYLLLGLITAFGIGFIVVWVRLEIINSTLEWIGVLKRALAGGPAAE
jgi:hypothetical protein